MAEARYDVLIIGGGPAGSMAALTAANRGLSVLMVERDHTIGSPVRCAEGVDDTGLREFFEPDQSWIATDIRSYALVAPDGTEVVMSTNGYTGYILERVLFDRMIAEEAARAGAVIRTATEAVAMTPYENGRRTVTLRNREGEWTVRANVVIAADGVESRVARWAGLATTTPLHDMETSVQVTCAGLVTDPHVFKMYFTGDHAPGGYAWLFPKKAGTANIGLGISGDYARDRSPHDRLRAFLDRYFPDVSEVSRTCGGISCTGGIRQVVDDGLMVTGDAAHHANPITGGGIINALIAGRAASEVAADALAAGRADERALVPYAKRMDKRITTMNRRFYKLKEGVFNIPDERLNDIAAEMINVPLEKRTPIRVLRAALMKKPELLLVLAKVVL